VAKRHGENLHKQNENPIPLFRSFTTCRNFSRKGIFRQSEEAGLSGSERTRNAKDGSSKHQSADDFNHVDERTNGENPHKQVNY
jgi:hypothetical protein